MRINHIAMYVADLEAAKQFFVRYFGAVSNERYWNHHTEFKSYFLSFDDGTRIELMNQPCITEKYNDQKTAGILQSKVPGYAHIAFNVGSKEKVDEMTRELERDGYRVISGPRTTGDGYYESCIEAVENNVIEITI